jgi:chemotaxis receptor (MCP) glutamine deamidase CheD
MNGLAEATVLIQPGEIHVSRKPVVIRTVLGSCVSVCLHDPEAQTGGMNHFMLPGVGPPGAGDTGRYGAPSIDRLLNSLMALGACRERLIAKVFGGAKVLLTMSDAPSVADANVKFALLYLERARIPIVAHRLGGVRPLEVWFSTAAGRTLVREVMTERNSGNGEDRLTRCVESAY